RQRLVLAGEEGLALVGLGDDAPLEAPDLVDQRPLHVQARAVVLADDAAELRADGQLVLADLEQASPGQRRQHQREDDEGLCARHQRTPRVRPSTVTAGSSCVGAAVWLSGTVVDAPRAALRCRIWSSGR